MTLACLDPATTNVLPPLMVLVVGVTVTVPVPPAIMSKLHVANVLVACGRVTATALALVYCTPLAQSELEMVSDVPDTTRSEYAADSVPLDNPNPPPIVAIDGTPVVVVLINSPVANPESAVPFNSLALTTPVLVNVSVPPAPNVIVAVVFVPDVTALKAGALLHPAPEPDITPDVLACKHCVDPVMPVSVNELNDPAAGVVPPIAGGAA